MADKQLEILELGSDIRELVRECELTGRRTFIVRDGRGVAALISYDEYLALRETVELAGDDAARKQFEAAEDEVRRGALLLVEDLVEGPPAGD